MLFIEIQNGKAVNATSEFPKNALMGNGVLQNGFESRHNWKTFELAAQRAAELNVAFPSRTFLPVDSGANVWPRFDVMEAPRVGDDVSYGFNGDYYPDGKIVKVSTDDRMRIITTSTGSRYFRRKLSGAWIKSGGTWSLVQGHINERNPSF